MAADCLMPNMKLTQGCLKQSVPDFEISSYNELRITLQLFLYPTEEFFFWWPSKKLLWLALRSMPKIGQMVVCEGSKQNSSGWLVLISPLRIDKQATEWGELPLVLRSSSQFTKFESEWLLIGPNALLCGLFLPTSSNTGGAGNMKKVLPQRAMMMAKEPERQRGQQGSARDSWAVDRQSWDNREATGRTEKSMLLPCVCDKKKYHG